MTHPPVLILPYLFWAASIVTTIVVLDLLFVCTSRKRFAIGWAVTLVSLLSLVAFHLSDNYTGAGINEATLYHLKYGREGLTWGLVAPIVQTIFLASLAAICAGFVSWRLMKKRAPSSHAATPTWKWFSVYLLALCLSPGLAQGAGLIYSALHRNSYRQDLAMHMTPTPHAISTSNKLKSVVYIYAESLEGQFLDEKQFPGLTPNLSELQKQGLSLQGLRQAPFTGWTIAGIIASQCAFPSLGEQQHKKSASSADMMCLGDILLQKGYSLNYYNGADIKFGGKNLFFGAHGFEKVEGKDELMLRIPGRTLSNWGVHDDDLFGVVWDEFQRLSHNPQPFLLAALTVDTHPPHGFEGEFCKNFERYGDGKNGMLNAVHCSDKLIGDLVRKIQASGRKDIIIVIGSDHLQSASMSDARDRLNEQQEDRHNLWIAIGDQIRPQTIDREGTTFDIAPTLLPLMGVDIHSMNLGRDMRGSEPTLSEYFGREQFFDRVESVFARGGDGRWRQDFANPSKKTTETP